MHRQANKAPTGRIKLAKGEALEKGEWFNRRLKVCFNSDHRFGINTICGNLRR